MPDTSLLQPLPLTRDVEATPPVPIDVEPRTERHDWVFVGHHGVPTENDPPSELRVTESAELARTVDAFVARETAGHLFPYILLAPALAPAFEEQATRALVTAEKRRGDPPWPASVWEIVVDLNPMHAAWAESDRLIERDPDAATKVIDTATCELRDAIVAQVPGLDAEVCSQIMNWLERELDEWSPLRSGTLEEILTASVRARVHAQLYAAGRGAGSWQPLLTEPNVDELRQCDRPVYRTVRGTWLRTEKEYRRFEERRVLPVSLKQVLEFIESCHDERNEDCRAMPSEEKVGAWMKEKGIRDPVPGGAIAPTAAARLAARGITETPSAIAVVPYLAWASRVTLLAAREKDGKSTLVGGAVAALTRGALWLGQSCAPVGPVLWLHEELEDDVIGRLQQFGTDLSRVHLLQLPRPDAAGDLAANAARLRPVLIVVDSLTRYVPGRVTDPTRATQWEPVMSEFLRVAQQSGAAILVVHHAGKKDGEYRDSTEIGAGVDMLIQMPRGLRGNRQALVAAGRIIGVAPYTITVELVGTEHRLVGADRAASAKAPAAVAPLSERDRAVLATLVGTKGYSEWFAASGLKSKKSFNGIVQQLITAGAVEKTTRGQYRASQSGGPGGGLVPS